MKFNDLCEAYGISDRKFDPRIKYLYDQIKHTEGELKKAGYEVTSDIKISKLRDIADQIATGIDDPETGSSIHVIKVKRDDKIIDVGIWMWKKDVVTMTVRVKGSSKAEGGYTHDDIDFSYEQEKDSQNVLSDSVVHMVKTVDEKTL